MKWTTRTPKKNGLYAWRIDSDDNEIQLLDVCGKSFMEVAILGVEGWKVGSGSFGIVAKIGGQWCLVDLPSEAVLKHGVTP